MSLLSQQVSSILTLAICSVGLVGNFLSLIVLSQKEMRSSCLYNLFGLSISDILLLSLSILRTLENMQITSVGSPTMTEVIFIWDWIATAGTKYFTVAVSVERFIVVTYPLKARQWLTFRRSKMYAGLVFLMVICITVSSYLYENYLDRMSFDIYAVVVLHFSPFILVVIFNVLIFVGLRRSRKQRKSLTSAEVLDESVTKMLFGVVTVFGFCYSFEMIRRVMNFAWPEYMSQCCHYDYAINHLADIFYVVNSSVNFAIYYLIGTKFRKVFCRVFRIHCKSTNSTKQSSVITSQKLFLAKKGEHEEPVKLTVLKKMDSADY